MAIAAIIIRQGDANTTPGSRDNLVLGETITLLNTEGGVSSYLWQFVDKPAGSSATISTPTESIATFTPDVVGTYLIRLSINNGSIWSEEGAAIRTTNLGIRIPAVQEVNEFDQFRGWGAAVAEAFQKIDEGYGAISSEIPPLAGEQYAVLLENPVGTHSWEKLTGDKILDKYAITSFALDGYASAVEVGSTVTAPAFTASYNRTATTVSINDGSGASSISLPATSFAYNGGSLPLRAYTKNSVNDTQTFTLTASDGVASTVATTTIQWQPKVYYGSQVPFDDFVVELTNGDFEGNPSVWNGFSSGGGAVATANATTSVPVWIPGGNFELSDGGLDSWTITIDDLGSGVPGSVELVTTPFVTAHGGTHAMLLGDTTDPFTGDAFAYKDITVPTNGTTTVSFWIRSSAPDSINFDWFQGHIRNAANTTLLVDLFSGLPGSHTGSGLGAKYYGQLNSWTNVTANLTPYAGQTVRLFFLAHDDGAAPAPSYIIIDDIQLINTYPHGGTRFGLLTATAPGEQSGFNQSFIIPSGSTFLDGYYRAFGFNGPSQGGPTQVMAIYDSTGQNQLDVPLAVDGYEAAGEWEHFSIDLSPYAGQTIIIAFFCLVADSGQLRIFELDDLSFISDGASVEAYAQSISSRLQPTKATNAELTTTIAANQYLIWMSPTTYDAQAPDFIDAETGLPIGMTKTGTAIEVSNSFNIVINYDIWQSEYPALGSMIFYVRGDNE